MIWQCCGFYTSLFSCKSYSRLSRQFVSTCSKNLVFPGKLSENHKKHLLECPKWVKHYIRHQVVCTLRSLKCNLTKMAGDHASCPTPSKMCHINHLAKATAWEKSVIGPTPQTMTRNTKVSVNRKKKYQRYKVKRRQIFAHKLLMATPIKVGLCRTTNMWQPMASHNFGVCVYRCANWNFPYAISFFWHFEKGNFHDGLTEKHHIKTKLEKRETLRVLK